MTIARKLLNRIVWKCDICGAEDIWQTSWWCMSSYLLEESFAEDVFTICSDECKHIAENKMKEGEIKLPILRILGYSVKKTKDRIGY